MTDHPDIAALRQNIEQLWQQYLDPRTTERERQRIGWEIDATFERVRHCPEWLEVFLSTDEWSGD